jgi:hypothetical protein
VDVLQLATETEVYVFHLSQMWNKRARQHQLPAELAALLKDETKRFVGRGIRGDFTRVANHFFRDEKHFWPQGRAGPPANTVDIAAIAEQSIHGAKFTGSDSLEHLCRELLGLELDKQGGTRTSSWRYGDGGDGTLTPAQLGYAAVDAAVHLACYKKAVALGRPTLEVGGACNLLDRSGTVVAASGDIAALDETAKNITVTVAKINIRCPALDLPAGAVPALEDARTFKALVDSDQDEFVVTWDLRQVQAIVREAPATEEPVEDDAEEPVEDDADVEADGGGLSPGLEREALSEEAYVSPLPWASPLAHTD